MIIRIGDQQFILGETIAPGEVATVRSDGKAYRARQGDPIAFVMPLAQAWGFADVPSFMHAVSSDVLVAAKDRAPPHVAWLRFATLLSVNSARR